MISFLSAVLALDEKHAIVDVTLLNPYEAPKTKYMRDSFLDVKCRDVRGVSFIVEMQVAYVAGFEKRVIYNASKAFDLANRANMTSKELDAYDASITVMLDERGRIEGAYEKGEQNKAYEIARSMKQKNMKANLIAELTGLSGREIERLD